MSPHNHVHSFSVEDETLAPPEEKEKAEEELAVIVRSCRRADCLRLRETPPSLSSTGDRAFLTYMIYPQNVILRKPLRIVMAEFPHLGRHCGIPSCNQLDFLPILCNACRDSFCNQHFSYEAHSCQEGLVKDARVPECPLCSKPVPTPKGQLPDIAMNEHISNNCEISRKKRIFTNQCGVKGCKKRELVPVRCPSCSFNYCLRHRHEQDHDCENKGGKQMSNAAIAAISRSKQTCSKEAQKAQLAADENLARQLAMEGSESLSPEELDRRLAQQLQMEENSGRRGQTTGGSSSNKCTIS